MNQPNRPMLKEKDENQKPWLYLPEYTRICQDGECDVFSQVICGGMCARCLGRWLGHLLNDTEATTVGYGTSFAGNGLICIVMDIVLLNLVSTVPIEW